MHIILKMYAFPSDAGPRRADLPLRPSGCAIERLQAAGINVVDAVDVYSRVS